ncbi:hypothetical protein GNY06_02050 [Elizabethkingia argentiflava]|uniref:Lipoprotein n=1 Tax=Elizabethkingia argenteiflava TaxID=2681556 RepID=A0A845PPG2_9FLAO|nr:DUF6263 family protein [Elizabethkingia argenteiflava]NAW50219.1 hypothetical protein [Elizabethkingia argenteiflava]
MKKALAFTAITLTLLSCKKGERFSDTHSENIKKETSTAPVAEIKEEIKPAISDSAGVYTLKYKLEPGKTYPFILSQKDVQSLSMGDKSESNTNETTDNISFAVNSFNQGIYDIDVHFISKKQIGSSQGKSIKVDTDGPEPKNENLKLFWKVNKALMGNSLKMKMNESGNIISFEGFEPIYTKINSTVNNAVKDAKQRKSIIEGFKQGFNEEALKAQFKTNINLFPEKGWKIGQNFTESAQLSPDGKIKSTTTFSLAKVENGTAEIKIKGGIPKKSNKQSKNGITQTVSLEGVQTGSLKLDTETGWMKSSTISMTTTQSQTLSDGKQSQTATQKNISTTKINP